MALSFNVNDASGYEQLMGRWSKKLAPLFIDFAEIAPGERVLDVGCGTGSLTFALAQHADLSAINAVDLSPVFVAAARQNNTDARVSIELADACDLPFQDRSFDRSLAMLVLHFIPQTGTAI